VTTREINLLDNKRAHTRARKEAGVKDVVINGAAEGVMVDGEHRVHLDVVVDAKLMSMPQAVRWLKHLLEVEGGNAITAIYPSYEDSVTITSDVLLTYGEGFESVRQWPR
jgi:hypothetical protein